MRGCFRGRSGSSPCIDGTRPGGLMFLCVSEDTVEGEV